MIDFVLRERTGRADGEKFRRDSNEPRKQKLLAIEFRAEARHGVKQSARQFLARPRRVIHMLLQIAMEIVDLAGAA